MACLVVIPQYQWYDRQSKLSKATVETGAGHETIQHDQGMLVKPKFQTNKNPGSLKANSNAKQILNEKERELQDANTRVIFLEKELSTSNARAKSLEKELNTLQNEFSVNSKEIQALKQKLNEGTIKEKALSVKIDTLLSKTADKDLIIDQLKAKLAILDDVDNALPTDKTTAWKITLFGSKFAVYLDVLLILFEILLLLGTCISLLSAMKSRKAAQNSRQKYLVAYRRQQGLLARAEDVFMHAEQYLSELKDQKAALDIANNSATADEENDFDACTAMEALNNMDEEGIDAGHHGTYDKASKNAIKLASWAKAAARLLQLAASHTSQVSMERQEVVMEENTQDDDDIKEILSPIAVADAVTERCNEIRHRLQAALIAAGLSEREKQASMDKEDENISTKILNTGIGFETLKQQLVEAEEKRKSAENIAEGLAMELNEVRAKLSTLENEQIELEKNATVLQAELVEGEEGKKSAESRAEELAMELNKARAKLSNVEKEQLELEKRAAKLQAELTEAEERLRLQRKHEAGLESQVNRLTNSLEKETSTRAEVERKCSIIEEERKSLQVLAENLQAQVQNLETKLEAAKSEVINTKGTQKFPLGHPIGSLNGSDNDESVTNEVTTKLSSPRSLTFSSMGEKQLTQTKPSRNGNFRKYNYLIHPAKYFTNRIEEISCLLGSSEPPISEELNQNIAQFSSVSPRALAPRNIDATGKVFSNAEQSVDWLDSSLRATGGNESSLPITLNRTGKLFAKAEKYLGPTSPASEGESRIEKKAQHHAADRLNSVLSDLDIGNPSLSSRSTIERKNDKAGKIDRQASETRAFDAIKASSLEVDRVCEILQAISDTEANNFKDKLQAAQRALDEARESSILASEHSSHCREMHAKVIAQEKKSQSLVAEAEKGLYAAMKERKINGLEAELSNTKNNDADVASAAEALRVAKEELQRAQTEVYEAETGIHSAASNQLQTSDVLREAQEALEELLKNATSLLSSSDSETIKKNTEAETVSPRIPLSIEESDENCLDGNIIR